MGGLVRQMKTADHVPGSALTQDGDFWGKFSENAPFSWGDNNLTLVSSDRFKEHALSLKGDPDLEGFDFDRLERGLRFLLDSNIYIDLES
jgi:hypothetical protein